MTNNRGRGVTNQISRFVTFVHLGIFCTVGQIFLLPQDDLDDSQIMLENCHYMKKKKQTLKEIFRFRVYFLLIQLSKTVRLYSNSCNVQDYVKLGKPQKHLRFWTPLYICTHAGSWWSHSHRAASADEARLVFFWLLSAEHKQWVVVSTELLMSLYWADKSVWR